MQSTLKIDPEVMSLLKQKTPKYLSVTGVANLLLQQALTSSSDVLTLGSVQGRDPSKAVNRKEEERAGAREVVLSEAVRAEEVHNPSAPKRKPAGCHKVDEELSAFEPQIRAYWAVKPKTKTDAAWKLLMRELNRIHDKYGSDVLEEQLLQAEANRWQSITLKNYEEFGVSRAHRPGQSNEPEFKHPAHEVFRAEDLYAKPEWQTPTEAAF